MIDQTQIGESRLLIHNLANNRGTVAAEDIFIMPFNTSIKLPLQLYSVRSIGISFSGAGSRDDEGWQGEDRSELRRQE